MNYSEIYLAIASVSTIAVAGVMLLCLIYILSIIRDVKKVSKIARREADMIARGLSKGMSILGSEISLETASFLKTVFALLLSQFGVSKQRAMKKSKIKSI